MFTQNVNDLLVERDPLGIVLDDEQSDEYWALADAIERETVFNGYITVDFVEAQIEEIFGLDSSAYEDDDILKLVREIGKLPLD